MTAYFDDVVAAVRPAVDEFITGVVVDATSALQDELADAKSELEQAQMSNALLVSQNQDLQTQHTADVAEIGDLNRELADKAAQIVALQARIAELEAGLPQAPTAIGAAATAKPGQTYPSGIHSDTGEYKRLESLVGKTLGVRRTFESVPATFAATKAAQYLGAPDTIHVISLKPSIETAGSPGWIAWAEGFIDSFPAKGSPQARKTVVTVQHEASAKPLDIAKFKATFRAFAEVVKRVRGDRDITVAWIETGWLYAPASGKNALDWYPGDDAVEMVAPDPYNLNPAKYFGLDQADIVGAKQAYEFAKTHGKRFGIAEWGCNDTTASNRAKFITDGTAWAKALGRGEGDTGPVCEFLAWFHSDVPVADSNDFFLDSSAASLNAYRATV